MADEPSAADMTERLGKVKDALAKMMEMHATAGKHLDDAIAAGTGKSADNGNSTKSKSPLYDNQK